MRSTGGVSLVLLVSYGRAITGVVVFCREIRREIWLVTYHLLFGFYSVVICRLSVCSRMLQISVCLFDGE